MSTKYVVVSTANGNYRGEYETEFGHLVITEKEPMYTSDGWKTRPIPHIHLAEINASEGQWERADGSGTVVRDCFVIREV